MKNKKERLFYVASLVIVGVLVVASVVRASSTISTNIQTDGTLSVTGTSTLMGNVGIGTTSPIANLQVSGKTLLGGINSVPVSGILDDQHTSLVVYNDTDPSTGWSTLAVGSKMGSANYSAGSLQYGFTDNENAWHSLYNVYVESHDQIGTNHNFCIDDEFLNGNCLFSLLSTGDVGLGRMSDSTSLSGAGLVVKNTGNVGIGTTTPAYPLTVVGDIRGTGNLLIGPDESTLDPLLQDDANSDHLITVDHSTDHNAFGVEAQSNQFVTGIYGAALSPDSMGVEGDGLTKSNGGSATGITGYVAASGSITVNSLSSIVAQAPVLQNGAAATNMYGLQVQDVTGGTNNYAIKTGLGKVEFGDNVTVDSLAGTGNAYACLDSTGKLFRSDTPCVPQ